MSTKPLLGPDDPAPFTVHRAGARSPWLLIGDHAGQGVPRALERLGLPQPELDRHIGWDLGVRGVIEALSAELDATAIVQHYSRLVIDCNRPPGVPSSIPALSDGTAVPGNAQLDAEQANARADAIFWPYHRRIEAELERRRTEHALQPTVLLSLHSFTPIWQGFARPWHCGTLYHRDARLAQALRAALQHDDAALVVGDNQPYAATEQSDYAIPVHGERRGLLHVGFEMRQDLLAEPDGQRAWAQRLARVLRRLDLTAQAHGAT